MKTIKWIAVLMALACLLSACSGDTDGTPDNEKDTPPKENHEVNFMWQGDLITGLTTAGEGKKTLVIPERCKGFAGDLFITGEEAAEKVVFEGAADLDIGTLFGAKLNIREVVLPAQLTVIPDMAFFNCTGLTEIVIPDKVTSVGYSSFECSGIRSVTFGENALLNIGGRAFMDCTNLKQITLPDSVTDIGEKAFYGCTGLTELTLPASVKHIGAFVLEESGIKDLYIPEGVVLEGVSTDAFVLAKETLTVHVVEGSWMDLHFDEIFIYECVKTYE